MLRQSCVMRPSALVLVFAIGVCMVLAGCGGGGSSSSPISEASASGGRSGNSAPALGDSASSKGNSSTCATFATAYKKFLAGHTPPESETGNSETPLQALSDAVAMINASGQLKQDLADLGIDAGLIATGSTEGGQTTPPSAFYSDLQAVGKDCGMTFAQPPASLVREG